MDTAQSFKDLEKTLCSALREEPSVRGIIYTSLQILIQQNKSILEATDEISITDRTISEGRAISKYSSQVAADNLNVLRSSARALLSVLSEVFFKSSKDTSGPLQVISIAFLWSIVFSFFFLFKHHKNNVIFGIQLTLMMFLACFQLLYISNYQLFISQKTGCSYSWLLMHLWFQH